MKIKSTIKLLLFLVLLLIIHACKTTNWTTLAEPEHKANLQYVEHFAYSLQYNESTEQALWVAYQLKASELEPNFKRKNRFIEDTLVSSGTATNQDYKGSGYDKGHLAPAADMAWNEQAMTESFFYSNISPQLLGFNRGIWKKLEIQTREWAMLYDSIYIATGPIFMEQDSSIGSNEIYIPTHYFKAILVYQDTIQQSIGFVFPHKKSNQSIFSYAVSVDSIENLTQLDLFHQLRNREEADLESIFRLEFWNVDN